MTIPLTGTGGLFTRIGTIGATIYDTNTFQGTTLITDVDNVLAQYAGGSADEALIDGIPNSVTSTQSGAGTILNFLQQVAVNTVNEMVFLDNPLLSNTNLLASLQEVITQMMANSDSVQTVTVGASSTPGGSNLGNGVCVPTTYRPDGLKQQNLIVEDVTVAVTADSTSNSNLAGNETFSATGTVAETNTLASDWPLGSAATVSLSAVNASNNNRTGNLLTNSDFENWTSNTPNNWNILVGTAGTEVLESTGHFYTGSASCEFVGTASSLTSIAQTFGSSGGTLGNPSNLSLYAFNCWIYCDQVSPQAGVLTVDLVNGSNTVVQDDQGNNNTYSVNLDSLTVSTWTPFNGAFRLPYILPSTLKLRVHLTTAVTASTHLYIDRLGFGAMTELYQGGPAFTVFSGSENFFSPDFFTVATTSSRPSNLKTFQCLCQRLFNLNALGLVLPSSGSPTISDSLI